MFPHQGHPTVSASGTARMFPHRLSSYAEEMLLDVCFLQNYNQVSLQVIVMASPTQSHISQGFLYKNE
jgi:hypothetical protein